MKYSEGMLMRHPARPDWGPGKVLRVRGDIIDVFFAGIPGIDARKIHVGRVPLEAAAESSHSWLDNLPPFTDVNGTLRMDEGRLTPKQAVEKFLAIFPRGFEDPAYLGDVRSGERNYKLGARDAWAESLGDGQAEALLHAGNIAEFIDRALKVESQLNLLSVFEKSALRQGLTELAAARRFFAALLDFSERQSADPVAFAALVDAVEDLPQPGSRVATWPVVTLFPFVAHPDRHMFIKPEMTKEAGRRHGYELNYHPHPNWKTYASCLGLAKLLMDELRGLGARDLIDVQSFMWVVSSYEDRPVEVSG